MNAHRKLGSIEKLLKFRMRFLLPSRLYSVDKSKYELFTAPDIRQLGDGVKSMFDLTGFLRHAQRKAETQGR
jgi:hypothetical protein